MSNSSSDPTNEGPGAVPNPGIPAVDKQNLVVGEIIGGIVLMFAALVGLLFWQLRQQRRRDLGQEKSATAKKVKALWGRRKKPKKTAKKPCDPVELAEAGQINEADGHPKAHCSCSLREIDGSSKHELEHHSIYELSGEARSKSVPWF